MRDYTIGNYSSSMAQLIIWLGAGAILYGAIVVPVWLRWEFRGRWIAGASLSVLLPGMCVLTGIVVSGGLVLVGLTR